MNNERRALETTINGTDGVGRGLEDGLELTMLAEQIVVERRRAIGSTATHPPTRREFLTALVYLPEASVHLSDEIGYLAELHIPCAATLKDVSDFMRSILTAEKNHFETNETFTSNVAILGLRPPPAGFRLALEIPEPDPFPRFVATLSAEARSGLAGEVWTYDSERHYSPARIGRRCGVDVDVDVSTFAPLLSEGEARAVADLVAGHALVDKDQAAAVGTFDKVLRAYSYKSRVDVASMASVSAGAVRQFHPELDDQTQRRLVEGFIPNVGDFRQRQLLKNEVKDLLELFPRPTVSPLMALRRESLLQKVGATNVDFEPHAAALLAVVREHQPAREGEFLKRLRPGVCYTTEHVPQSIVSVGPLGGSPQELQEFADKTAKELRDYGFQATVLDAASAETFAIDAVMPASSIVGGHHVRIEGNSVRVVHDVCADLNATSE